MTTPNFYLMIGQDRHGNGIQCLVPFGGDETKAFAAQYGDDWDSTQPVLNITTVFGSTIDAATGKPDLLRQRDRLREALRNLFHDWDTLVGQDLRENNADVQKLWRETEAALNETESA